MMIDLVNDVNKIISGNLSMRIHKFDNFYLCTWKNILREWNGPHCKLANAIS